MPVLCTVLLQDMCERVSEVVGVDMQNISIVHREQGLSVERLLPDTVHTTSE